jgi:hypothetical protein
MATKTLFGGARKKLVGTVLLSVGGLALSACCCDPCNPCKSPCYRKPCCAQQGGGMACGGGKACGGKAAPAPAPAGAPAGAGGGQMSCGAGKCG